LADEDAGKLIKALFAYVDEGQLPDFNGPMMVPGSSPGWSTKRTLIARDDVAGVLFCCVVQGRIFQLYI